VDPALKVVIMQQQQQQLILVILAVLKRGLKASVGFIDVILVDAAKYTRKVLISKLTSVHIQAKSHINVLGKVVNGGLLVLMSSRDIIENTQGQNLLNVSIVIDVSLDQII